MEPITVLTLTFNRYKILQEAINSFVLQNRPDCEMLIINDQSSVTYTCDIPNVRIINAKERFPTVFDKLRYGYSQSKHEFAYRLDDDDLLAEDVLGKCQSQIEENKGYELYRSGRHFMFVNNQYRAVKGNVNTGNIFSKTFVAGLKRDEVKNRNVLHSGQDLYMLRDAKPKTYTFSHNSMIYRWGMNTYHLSGFGLKDTGEINKRINQRIQQEKGTINLVPKFENDYYKMVREGEGK